MRFFLRRVLVCFCSLILCAACFAHSVNQAPVRAVEVTAWKVLTDGVAEQKSLKRADAITALGTIGRRPKVVKLVEAALADKDPQIRQIAAVTLGQMKSRSSIPRLRKALDDEDPSVAFDAACALWKMGDHSGRSILIEMLANDRNATKESIQAGLQTVKRKLRSPEELGKTGAKEGVHALLGPFALGLSVAEELTDDRSAQARALSATLLATDRQPQSRRELDDALADKNWAVRAAAAKAIGGGSRRELIPKLRPLLNDEKDAVRYMAAAAIVRLSEGNIRPR